MLGDPFIKLILYLLLAACAIWAFRYVLTQMRVPDPPNWIFTLVVGVVLVLLAFRMAGIGLY